MVERFVMPRFKVLKGVAHNIGHSFTSSMNYAIDDHTIGHVLRLARESGKNTLEIDFMTGTGVPRELLQEPIAEVPLNYTNRFWQLVQSSGSDRSLVKSAKLRLKYDLEKTLTGSNGKALSQYDCEVSIVDIRDKNYSAHFHDWWYVDRAPTSQSRVWWKPATWFRRSVQPL